MPLLPVQFGPGSGPERSGYANDGVLVNCFAEPSRGKTPFAVYAAPGLATFSTFSGGGTVRGRFKIGNLMYVVCGETLYKVTSGGTSSTIGTILGSLPITAAVNRKSPFQQAFIVADNNYYLLENDALSELVTGVGNFNLPAGGHSVAFLDGYLIVGFANGQFNWSAINDAEDFNALDFAEAEAKDDNLVRVAIFGDRLFLFGEASVEQWVNSGDTDLPFVPQQGALIERGCLAKLSPVDMDNTIFWLDQKGFVVRSEGAIGRVVSTYAVHRDIQATMKLGEQNLISASSWSRDGHEFYELHGPDWCWVYDASTQQWWKRESEGQDTWRGRFHIRVFDKDLVCANDTASLYDQADDVLDEVGHNLVVTMRSSPVHSSPQRLRHNALYLDMEMGVGASNGELPPSGTRVWTFNADTEDWTIFDGTLTQANGTVTLAATGTNMGFISPDNLSMNGTDYPFVYARMRRTRGTGWAGFAYWDAADTGTPNFSKYVVATEPANFESWQIVTWDMSDVVGTGADWIGNTIRKIQFSLGSFATDEDDFEIDWIAVSDSTGLDHINNPAVMVRWSDDGGNRFSNQLDVSLGNTEETLGLQGDYEKRIRLNRLGISGNHGRIYELSMSAPVERVLVNANVDVTGLGA